MTSGRETLIHIICFVKIIAWSFWQGRHFDLLNDLNHNRTMLESKGRWFDWRHFDCLQLIKTFNGIFKRFTLIARVAKWSQGGEMNSRWLERSLRHVLPSEWLQLASDWSILVTWPISSPLIGQMLLQEAVMSKCSVHCNQLSTSTWSELWSV